MRRARIHAADSCGARIHTRGKIRIHALEIPVGELRKRLGLMRRAAHSRRVGIALTGRPRAPCGCEGRVGYFRRNLCRRGRFGGRFTDRVRTAARGDDCTRQAGRRGIRWPGGEGAESIRQFQEFAASGATISFNCQLIREATDSAGTKRFLPIQM